MNNNGKNKSGLSSQERVALLESLLEFSEPWTDNGPIFVEHLDDEDPQVRAMAIQGLWFFPDPAVLDRLMEIANHDPDPTVRTSAIGCLGIFMYEGEMADYDFDWGEMTEIMREDELLQPDFERVVSFLMDVYADESRTLDERRHAIEALGFTSDPEIADLIETVYNRPEREMKISALFAMGRSGLVRWTDILAREIHSDDADIQREAIRAVGEIGLDELGEDLLRITYSGEREVLLDAVEALGKTGWEGAFERLEELTLDLDEEIAEVAEEALDEWLWLSEADGLLDEMGLDEDWDDEE